MKHVKALTSEERLLVLLNLAKVNATERMEIRRLASSKSMRWSRVLELAELNAVLPLSLARLTAEKCVGRVPTALLEKWKSKAAPIRAKNKLRSKWAHKMLEAMNAASVEMIVLKGSMFADAIYGDRSYKKMNDVDVLVKRADAPRVIQVLKGLDFQGVGALFGKEEISANSHHTPPYVSSDLGCVIGLHWGLVSPMSPWQPDTAGIWKRKVAQEVAGAAAFRMSWEDNLLHLCIHLPFFKTGLRELADVYNVARQGIDWNVFARLVKRWGAEDPAYRVLALANALVDLGVPPRLWMEWKDEASNMTLEDTAMRLAIPSLILRSRCTQAAKIEKAYAVFMLSEKYSERLKAWAGMYALLLWPKSSEVLKITGRSDALGRVTAPVRLWNAMARDHGHFPLVAMTAANAALLARASLDKAMQPLKGGRSLREHPAAPLLEVLE